MQMLGGAAALAGGCHLDDASIQPDHVEARYKCPGAAAPWGVSLLPPDAPMPPDARRTARFLVAPGAHGVPAALLDDVAAHVRAREAAWIWDVEADHVRPDSPIARKSRVVARPWPAGMLQAFVAAVAFAILAAAALGIALLRAPPRDPAPRWRPSTLTAAFAALAALTVALAVARFHLVFDDYRFLVRARDDPWAWDESLRVLSTSCVFRLSVLAGAHGHLVLCAANAAALLCAATGWAVVVRRAGADRDTAALAAALFVLAPGTWDLLRWGSGVENLGGSACAILALAALASAPPPGAAPRFHRAAHLAAVVAITLLGMFVKYPFMATVPPAAALVAVGLHRARPRAALALGVGLAALVAILCVIGLTHVEERGLATSFGLSRVWVNLGAMAADLRPWVAAVGSALGVLATVRAVRAVRGDGAPGAVLRATGRIVSDARAALTAPVGPSSFAVGALALFVIFAAPTLVNKSYYPTYYVLLPTAALAALAATLLVRVGENLSRARVGAGARLPRSGAVGRPPQPVAGLARGAGARLSPRARRRRRRRPGARPARARPRVRVAAGERPVSGGSIGGPRRRDRPLRRALGHRLAHDGRRDPNLAVAFRSRGPCLHRPADGADAARRAVTGAPRRLSAARGVLHDGGRMNPRPCARLLACVASLAAALLLAPAARACDDVARAWAARCSAGEGVAVQPETCLPELLVVVASAKGGAPLRVEIDRTGRRGFVHAGSAGVSPLGEFADWSKEPAPTRRAFDAVVACAARGLPEVGPEVGSAPSASPSPPPPPPHAPPPQQRVPWALGGAVLAFLALGATRLRRPSRRALVTAAGLVGLTVLTWLVRRAAFPESFFHPNGQGPLWVGFALGAPTDYGPGFRELFGLVVDGAAEPDRALVAAQSAAAALVPAFAFMAARASGGSRPVAWALALLVALDPVEGRAARTEAYYATIATLLFASAAALAMGTRALRVRSFAFVAGVVASGLFAAAAARVHPIAWVAAAAVPLGALAGRGRARRRLPVGIAAGALFTAVLAAVAGPAVLEVLRGRLGHQYGVGMAGDVGHPLALAALGGGALIAVAVLVTRRRSIVARALVLLAIVLAAVGSNHLGPVTPWVERAYFFLLVPAALFGVAVLLTPPPWAPASRVRLVYAALVAVAIVADLVPLRTLTARTTDEDEAAFVMRWRATLPRGAVVHYLGSAGVRRVFLPLYEGGGRDLRLMSLTAEHSLPVLSAGGAPIYYYESSLCATPEGRGFCAEIARHASLHEVARAELASGASMPSLDYGAAPVRVALYGYDGGR